MNRIERVPELVFTWRYVVLLAALALGLVVEPVVFGDNVSARLFDTFYSLMLIFTIIAFADRKKSRRTIIICGVATFLFTWLAHAVPPAGYRLMIVAAHLTGILFFLLAVFSILRAILAGPTLKMDSILGSIAGYLMLGMAWGIAYSLVHLLAPQSFQVGDQFTAFIEPGRARVPVFMYYSFITLTTVGYGDMTPVSDAARTLSWLEAITGQFYLAVIVAGIVSVMVTRARSGEPR
jgi:hypothetical protein